MFLDSFSWFQELSSPTVEVVGERCLVVESETIGATSIRTIKITIVTFTEAHDCLQNAFYYFYLCKGQDWLDLRTRVGHAKNSWRSQASLLAMRFPSPTNAFDGSRGVVFRFGSGVS